MDRHASTGSGGAPAAPRARRRLPIEQRRAQVLDAALRLIAGRGYAALSVEAIAREAGVSKTVVYDAYGGLGALLQALLEREERTALEAIARAAPTLVDGSGGDPAAALVGWIVNLGEVVVAEPVTWRLMLTPPDGTPPIVREHVQRGRDVLLEHARTLTGALLSRRRELAELDAELVARAVVALAEEAAKLLLDRPDEFPPERLAAFAAATLAVLAPERQQARGPAR